MLTRRELVATLLGLPVATMTGCSRPSLPPAGELLRTNHQVGHRWRDRNDPLTHVEATERTGVVIVGAGIAGLSAAWRLLEARYDDFLILELEPQAGGTSQGGERDSFAYPWGAHYVPVPMAENRGLIRLLQQMNLVEGLAANGSPIIAEQYLCRDPHERLYHDRRWHEGIYPSAGANDQDERELNEFRAQIDHWVDARDEFGRRMFAIPTATGSDTQQVQLLDKISMAHWMDQQGWSSERLRWLVDYACRDDYGLTIDRVSAWAGIFYFAARMPEAGAESQEVMTWPEGNGRIADHLTSRAGGRLRCGIAAERILGASDGDEVSVTAIDTETNHATRIDADRVIFAAPQFLTPYLIGDLDQKSAANAKSFEYGSWLVANIHLADRPAENAFPMSWDNVLFGSHSLGYVNSTHQLGLDHGPTVLTWYHPMASAAPEESRKKMLQLEWADWADLVMTDLRIAHPDIDALVTRVDIKCWGHAMIQPHPGFIWSRSRIEAARPKGAIHFAGTDLSGIALCEEAFYHGVRAAEEVLAARRWNFTSLL